jgi:hypothetical protein
MISANSLFSMIVLSDFYLLLSSYPIFIAFYFLFILTINYFFDATQQLFPIPIVDLNHFKFSNGMNKVLGVDFYDYNRKRRRHILFAKYKRVNGKWLLRRRFKNCLSGGLDNKRRHNFQLFRLRQLFWMKSDTCFKWIS